MSGRKNKLIKWIVIIAVICAIIFFYRWFKERRKIEYINSEFDQELAYNSELLAVDEEEINRKLMEEASDIEGWSNYDKKMAGLGTVDNSDVDLDGLSDKDEIEIYHSDPLKTSTSGDLYSDGYKVNNGLDINTYYEDSFVTYVNSIPEEITLYAQDASDNYTSMRAVQDRNEDVYKAYSISGFSGRQIDIDLTGIFEDTDIEPSKLDCYMKSFFEQKMVDIDYEIKDNTLSISYDFDKRHVYYIYIAQKSLMPSKLKRVIFGDEIEDEYNRLLETGNAAFFYINGHNAEDEEGIILYPLIITYPLVHGGIKPIVYHNVTSSGKKNMHELESLKEMAQHDTACDDVELYYKESNIVKIITLYEKLENFAGGIFNYRNESFPNFFFSYNLLSDYQREHGIGPVESNEKVSDSVDLDIVEDTLPFSNFSTVVSQGGTCMGIATLIAKLKNDGSIPPVGSSKYIDVSWDLSIDPENDTLMDPGLSDYKDADFKKKHLDIMGRVNADLSDGEKEFIKMLGCYFYDGNKIASSCSRIDSSKVGYELYKLRKVCRDNLGDKVLTLSMFDSNGYEDIRGGGHTINIYGYEDYTDTEGKMYLYAYDNNLPGDRSEGLRVEISTREDGSFDYLFKPEGVENYGYSSFGGDDYMFIIMDGDQNILFGTDDDIIPRIMPCDGPPTSLEEEKERIRRENLENGILSFIYK